jgi:hypothetical protein
VRSIYPVYLQVHLNADTEEPVAAVAAAWDFARQTAQYLWTHHFEARTFWWNVFCYPKVLETWKFEVEPLQFDDFWMSIWTEAPPGERPLSELYHDSVDRFWNSLAGEAGRSSTIPNSSAFAKRAAWVMDRLKERDWDHNRPVEHGGPDRKTMKRTLSGLRVHEGTLDKLLIALNKQRKGKVLTAGDIPDS